MKLEHLIFRDQGKVKICCYSAFLTGWACELQSCWGYQVSGFGEEEKERGESSEDLQLT